LFYFVFFLARRNLGRGCEKRNMGGNWHSSWWSSLS